MGVKRLDIMLSLVVKALWIPACAGMTELRKGLRRERGLSLAGVGYAKFSPGRGRIAARSRGFHFCFLGRGKSSPLPVRFVQVVPRRWRRITGLVPARRE